MCGIDFAYVPAETQGDVGADDGCVYQEEDLVLTWLAVGTCPVGRTVLVSIKREGSVGGWHTHDAIKTWSSHQSFRRVRTLQYMRRERNTAANETSSQLMILSLGPRLSESAIPGCQLPRVSLGLLAVQRLYCRSVGEVVSQIPTHGIRMKAVEVGNIVGEPTNISET